MWLALYQRFYTHASHNPQEKTQATAINTILGVLDQHKDNFASLRQLYDDLTQWKIYGFPADRFVQS